MLEASELRRRAGRHAEDDAGEGLDEQFLHAVGEHRNEDEDRELARRRLAPHLHESLTERRPLCAETGDGASVFDADDGDRRDNQATEQTQAVTTTRRCIEKGSRK